jgi:DNA polymerase III subunit epsilon
MSAEQLGLAFDLPFDSTPTPAQPTPKKRVATPVAPAPAPASLEDMAQALQAHPDYRVLRRLQPCLYFDHPTTGSTQTILLLDTETTGLNAKQDRILELALLRVVVDVQTGLPTGPVQVYDGLQDPGMPIPPAITDITGITDDMVRGQQLDLGLIAQLLQGVDVVIAHNAGFDRPFVQATIPAFAQLNWACSWADFDWKAQGHGSAKLEALALDAGWFYDAHRAEVDCHALLAVISQPIATTPTALAALLQAAQQTHYKVQAIGAPFDAKDALKTRGYRWNADQRHWATLVRSDEALAQECLWLGQTVYGRPDHSAKIEALTAKQRYVELA